MIRMIHGSTRIGVDIYSPRNGAFQADEATEHRLVSLGVAAYVAPPEPGALPKPTEDNALPPDYDATMKMDQLRAIMKEHGVPFTLGMSKADAVAALDAHFGFQPEDDDEAPPALGVGVPVA